VVEIINNRYVAGLRWDSLFGIERETREIKSLVKARDATHYVVVPGSMGAKSVGLAQIPNEYAADDASLLALLPLVAQTLDSKDFLFVHPLNDDDDKMIIFGVRDGRPIIDRIVEKEMTEAIAHDFLKEKTHSAVVVIGHWPDLPSDFPLDQPLSLTDCLESVGSSREAAATLIRAKSNGIKVNKMLLALIVITAAMAGGGYYGYQWYLESQVVEVDPVEVYVEDVRETFRMQTAKGGGAYADAMHGLITGLVVNAAGWQLQTIDCSGMSCRLVRARGIGADIDPILTSEATIELKDVPIAKETVRLPTARPPRDVRLIPIKSFYELSLARLMQLADYGLTPKVEAPTDLVDLPDGVSRSEIPEAYRIQRGAWSLKGNLAFLDSMTAIVRRAENMVLDKVVIDLKTMLPTFTATGFYYVR